VNPPHLIRQLRKAELEGDADGEPALLGIAVPLLSVQVSQIQMMFQVIRGPHQERVSLHGLQRPEPIQQPGHAGGMQTQLGEPGNDGLGRISHRLPHLATSCGNRTHLAIPEVSSLVDIVEERGAQQMVWCP
jgi:hypothetical protein